MKVFVTRRIPQEGMKILSAAGVYELLPYTDKAACISRLTGCSCTFTYLLINYLNPPICLNGDISCIWSFSVSMETDVRCVCGTQTSQCREQSCSKVCRELTVSFVCCRTRSMRRSWMLQVLIMLLSWQGRAGCVCRTEPLYRSISQSIHPLYYSKIISSLSILLSRGVLGTHDTNDVID